MVLHEMCLLLDLGSRREYKNFALTILVYQLYLFNFTLPKVLTEILVYNYFSFYFWFTPPFKKVEIKILCYKIHKFLAITCLPILLNIKILKLKPCSLFAWDWLVCLFYCETSPGAPCLKDFLRGFSKWESINSKYYFILNFLSIEFIACFQKKFKNPITAIDYIWRLFITK